MKKFFTVLLFLALSSIGIAQSLQPGDIAIIGVNADNPDDFAFVTLVELPAGSKVYFTDSGVKADSTFRFGEGALLYIAPGVIPVGTVISLVGNASDFTYFGDSNVGTNGFNLSSSGDQVIAFIDSTDNPTFIFAVQTNSNQWQDDATNSNTSTLPPGLTNGINAAAVGRGPGAGDEWDNAVYSEVVTTGTAATISTEVATNSNWDGSNSRMTLPSGPYTVSSAKIEPTNHVTNFAVSTTSAGSITLSWTGATNKIITELPDKYLIMGKTGSGIFDAVTDGTPVLDHSSWATSQRYALNVFHNDGSDSVFIGGLIPETSYDFIIYPYTNNGADIDYLTLATVPETTGMTDGIATYTITQIQDTTGTGSADSPLTGELIKTKGLVFANDNSFIWFMDGTGPWTGLMIDSANDTIAIGDSVEVTGTVTMNGDLTQISSVVGLTTISTGHEMPAPDSLSTGAIATGGPSVRMYQSAFVKVAGTVDNADLGFGEWSLDDGSGSVRMDDVFFAFVPNLGQDYEVQGPLFISFGNTKILPRDANDIMTEIPPAPVIDYSSIEQFPMVPKADQSVKITVNVEDDDQGSVVVELAYIVNDNSEVVVVMNNDSTTYYSYSMADTVYADGDMVSYQVRARNATSESIPSDWFGFFAGDANIETVRGVNVDGTTPYDGYMARISGIMTTPAQHLGNQDTYTALQVSVDQGIVALSFDSTIVAEEGDSLQITGEIGFYNGLLQIEIMEYIVLKTDTEVPAANELTLSNFIGDFDASEYYEGSLILIKNVEITSGSWGSGDQNFTVTDDAGTTSMTMRIFDVMGFWDIYPNQPTGTFDVVAVLGQYDFSSPYTSGYQLLPVDFPTLTDIADGETGLPKKFEMSQNYPNPFNPTTSVKFALPQAEEVTFSIFNVLGQRVFEQVQKYNAGVNVIEFNAASLSSGIYFYRIQAGQYKAIKKMMLVK